MMKDGKIYLEVGPGFLVDRKRGIAFIPEDTNDTDPVLITVTKDEVTLCYTTNEGKQMRLVEGKVAKLLEARLENTPPPPTQPLQKEHGYLKLAKKRF